MSTTHNEEGYNVVNALNAFKNAIKADGVTIDLPKFIIAYKELVKFFDYLGKIFSFVAADLVDKFNNLEKCMANDENNIHYVTIQSSIDYEKEKNIYMVNHNATLSILRLIRGLEFIKKFLEVLYQNMDSHKRSHDIGVEAYDATLSHRHKWAIRQLVKTGFYLLPKKSDLVVIMMHGAISDSNNHRSKESDVLFQDFLNVLNKVYSIIHKIYDENDFLELVLA